MTTELTRKFGKLKRKAYLAHLSQGMRRGASARAIGVDRAAIYRYMKKHPEFAEAIDGAELESCEIVEDALFQAAQSGNVVACQVWLYNRWSTRWMDKRNLAVSGKLEGDGAALVINVISAIPRPPEIVEGTVRLLEEGGNEQSQS